MLLLHLWRWLVPGEEICFCYVSAVPGFLLNFMDVCLIRGGKGRCFDNEVVIPSVSVLQFLFLAHIPELK